MEATLLTVGLVCLVAAVVGGGLKILGNEVPALQSVRRQVILGGVGVALIAGAFWDRLPVSRDRPGPESQPSNAAGNSVVPPSADAGRSEAADAAAAEEEAPAPAPAKPPEVANLNPAQSAPELLPPNGKPFRNLTQEAQYRLIALGFDVGYPDGFEGMKMTASLESFQRQHNLPISGTADAATLDLLRARSRKAFLLLKSGQGGEPTDYQKRWFPSLVEGAPED